jgi:acyl carrier protein
LQIAAQELGSKDGLSIHTRIADVFDSLDFVSYLMALKEAIGELPKEQAMKAETFGDIVRAYECCAIPS